MSLLQTSETKVLSQRMTVYRSDAGLHSQTKSRKRYCSHCGGALEPGQYVNEQLVEVTRINRFGVASSGRITMVRHASCDREPAPLSHDVGARP